MVEEQKNNKRTVNSGRTTKNCTQEREIDCSVASVIELKAAIPLKKIQEKTTPHARSVAFDIATAQRSGFAMTDSTGGSTKSVKI